MVFFSANEEKLVNLWLSSDYKGFSHSRTIVERLVSIVEPYKSLRQSIDEP